MKYHAPTSENLQHVTKPVGDFWDKLANLDMPSQSDFLQQLTATHAIYAILLLGCGIVCLVSGWKLFKTIVVINAAIIGAIIGNQLGGMLKGQNMPLFGALAGAVLFAALSWPMMKYAISLMGGLAGSFIGFGLWNYAANIAGKPELANYSWAGAIIGLITLGLLAFVIFRLVVIVFTSLQGSIMTVSGLLSLFLKYEPTSNSINDALAGNMHLFPLMIVVPAVIGLGLQYASLSQKSKKKKSEGD